MSFIFFFFFWTVTTTQQPTHRHIPTHNTHFEHRYRPTSLQVARGLHSYTRTVVSCMMWTCSPNREWTEAHALRHSQVRGRVYTERRLDERSFSLLLREERREREKGPEREEDPPLPPSSPCVGSKRLRVSVFKNASVCTGETRACWTHIVESVCTGRRTRFRRRIWKQ